MKRGGYRDSLMSFTHYRFKVYSLVKGFCIKNEFIFGKNSTKKGSKVIHLLILKGENII